MAKVQDFKIALIVEALLMLFCAWNIVECVAENKALWFTLFIPIVKA